MESQKGDLVEAESAMVASRGWWVGRCWSKATKEVSSTDPVHNMVTVVNTGKLLRE